MEKILSRAIAAADTVPHVHPIGRDANGRPVCSVCGDYLTTVVCMPWGCKTVGTMCRCDAAAKKAAEDAAEARKRALYLERMAADAYGPQSAYREMTFAHDDGLDAPHSALAQDMIRNWGEVYRPQGLGLLLYGPPGTGKTYLGACIVNALLGKGLTARVSSLPVLIDAFMAGGDGGAELLRSLASVDVVMLDDLGTEARTEYRREKAFEVINARYAAGLPTIYTTNLTLQEMRTAPCIDDRRIYERILERSIPVQMTVNRREAIKSRIIAEAKHRIGGAKK